MSIKDTIRKFKGIVANNLADFNHWSTEQDIWAEAAQELLLLDFLFTDQDVIFKEFNEFLAKKLADALPYGSELSAWVTVSVAWMTLNKMEVENEG